MNSFISCLWQKLQNKPFYFRNGYAPFGKSNLLMCVNKNRLTVFINTSSALIAEKQSSQIMTKKDEQSPYEHIIY